MGKSLKKKITFFDRWKTLHREDDSAPELQMKMEEGQKYFHCHKCHPPGKFIKAKTISSLDKHCATQKHKGESREDILHQSWLRHQGL